jgi:hypothetical protein
LRTVLSCAACGAEGPWQVCSLTKLDETEPTNHDRLPSAWRQREVEAVSSPAFRKALEDNHIILIGWREIEKLL